MPDEWLDRDLVIDIGPRRLDAVSTPGHTQGHYVFADEEASLLFAGDHVLSTITPSIGFEPAYVQQPLRDYLSSLAKVRALPDMKLLPAHGPVTESSHTRVDELVAHHDVRLDQSLRPSSPARVRRGRSPASCRGPGASATATSSARSTPCSPPSRPWPTSSCSPSRARWPGSTAPPSGSSRSPARLTGLRPGAARRAPAGHDRRICRRSAPWPPTLPQLASDSLFLTDGGLETTLVFLDGLDLPDFASFPLLGPTTGAPTSTATSCPTSTSPSAAGPASCSTPRPGGPTPTGARGSGTTTARSPRSTAAPSTTPRGWPSTAAGPDVVNGVVGPRGDGYVVGETMTADEAASYHSLQAQAFAAAGAQMMTAVTMTYADEAIGVVEAAAAADLPVVVSFTVETDGRLPSGQDLGDAIHEVDGGDRRGCGVLHGQLRPPHPLRLRPRTGGAVGGSGCRGSARTPRR